MTTLIHIGYPKTGSTWLQENFFKNNQIFFNANRRDLSLNFGHPKVFDFNIKKTKNFYKSFFYNLKKNRKIGVVSSEFLSGNLYLNGGMDSQIYADRLKSIFPGSKVLIIIREQSSFLYSFYKHDVSYNGGFWNIDEFLNPKWHFMRRSSFHPRYLLYSGLIEYYQKLFGKTKVLVLPFELLKLDSKIFSNHIFEFLNIKSEKIIINTDIVNESRNISTVCLQKIINRFFTARRENTLRINKGFEIFLNRKFFRKFDFKIPILDLYLEKNLRQTIDQFSESFFKNDNKKLQSIINFDLKKFSYKI